MQKNTISDIFASRQSQKILKGMITSIEPVRLKGEVHNSAIIVYEDYKVVLPVEHLGVRDDIKVLRSLIGAEISFVVIGIAEEIKVAIASRIQAMEIQRQSNANKNIKDKIITVKVTGIGKESIYVEAFGVETKIPREEVDYGYITNLRDYAQIGDRIKCKVLDADILNNKLELSMKALKEDPYENLEEKYPLNSEHLATITNIQPYGIFLTFDQNPKVSVLCPIPKWNNFSPAVRDKYVIRIKRIVDKKINGTLIRFVKRAEE